MLSELSVHSSVLERTERLIARRHPHHDSWATFASYRMDCEQSSIIFERGPRSLGLCSILKKRVAVPKL